MISSEKAFDILPYVSDIYEKLNLEKYILDIRKKNKGKRDKDELQVMGLGLNMGAYILKQSPKIKTEIFTIVAMIEDKTIEEVKVQSFTKTKETLEGLFKDEEAMDFFKSAVK